MANWQLILNLTGLFIIFSSGKFAKSAFAYYNEGNVQSLIATGSGFSVSIVSAMLLFHMALLKPSGSFTLKNLIIAYFKEHLLISVLSWLFYRKFQKQLEDPQKYQDEMLMTVLRENADTVFGKDHQLGSFKDRAEFVSNFPLTDYPFYEKYIDRIAKGEQNVMTKSKVTHLCLTSGTTGKNKLYPLTNRDMKPLATSTVAFVYVLYPRMNRRLARELNFSFSAPPKKSIAGLPIVGLGAARAPKFCKTVMPDALSRVTKEGPSFFVQALFALREKDIGIIHGFSSDLMYSFFKSMEQNKEKLARAIKTGHIEPFPDLDEDVRDELNSCLTPDENHGDEIRDLFIDGSVGLAKRLWPSLTFCILAKTGSFKHAATMLESSYLMGVKFGLGVHRSTEGFYGICANDEDLEEEILTFCPANVFLEFIKEEDMGKESPKTYLLEELEVDQSYELVVTNYHGIYRNRFGDVVKIVGFNKKCPKYKFQYRTGQVLNCGFERTTEVTFHNALIESEKEWGKNVQNYTATESINLENATGENLGKQHYVVFLEFQKGVVLPEEQISVLEKNLCKQNEYYAEFRKLDGIGPAEIIQVNPGAFDEFRAVMFGDRPNIQFKTPRVTRTESLLKCLWNNKLQKKNR